MKPYDIPASRRQIELVVLGSCFIATADAAPTVADARALLAEQRALRPDATHHAHAFAVGFGASVVHGMSDDGEPAGTAGRPLLAVVNGSGLGDVCVVVTRYFGGTKLGSGGLVRAYTQAGQEVLAELPRVRKIARSDLEIRLAYNAYEPLLRLVDAAEGEVLGTDFGEDVAVRLRLATDLADAFADAVRELTAGRAQLRVTGEGQGAP